MKDRLPPGTLDIIMAVTGYSRLTAQVFVITCADGRDCRLWLIRKEGNRYG